MGTACYIVIEHQDGTVEYILCSLDGYMSNMIPKLQNYSRSQTENLMKSGGISYLQEGVVGNGETFRASDRWEFRSTWKSCYVQYYYILTKEDEWECESKDIMRFSDILSK